MASHGDISVGFQLVSFHLENVVLQYSLYPDDGAASLALLQPTASRDSIESECVIAFFYVTV